MRSEGYGQGHQASASSSCMCVKQLIQLQAAVGCACNGSRAGWRSLPEVLRLIRGSAACQCTVSCWLAGVAIPSGLGSSSV